MLSQVLAARGASTVEPEERDALILDCLRAGDELLQDGRIASPTALSQPLFESGLKLAEHRGLRTGPQGALPTARDQFAIEVGHALDAINRLQERYAQTFGEDG